MEINISILKPDMFWVFMKKQSLSLDRELRVMDSWFITPVMTSCFCLKKKNLFEGFTLEITKVCCIAQLNGRLLPYSVLIITNDHKVRFGLTKLFFFFWPYFPYVYLDCTSWTYKPTVWLWALNSFGTLVLVFITNVLFPYDYSAIFLQFS